MPTRTIEVDWNKGLCTVEGIPLNPAQLDSLIKLATHQLQLTSALADLVQTINKYDVAPERIIGATPVRGVGQ